MTDAGVLKDACVQAMLELYANISLPQQDEPHVFSERFEKRIRKLQRHVRNDRYIVFTRSAKVALVAAIIALLLLLTATAAQLFGISFLKGEGFMDLILNLPLSGQNDPELECGYIPEGFELKEEYNDTKKVLLTYENSSSGEIQIIKLTDYDIYSVDTDRHQWSERTQNSITYHIGTSIPPCTTNIIIWIDPETNCLYRTIGKNVDVDTVFIIAQNVK